jgi:membrane protein DedA with SNARE-associated domain
VIEQDITNLLMAGMTTYGPVTLGVAMFLGTLGIPVPLPILGLAAGAFARFGSIKWGLAMLTALAGATLGDSLGYVVGHFASDWAERRYGEVRAWQKARDRFHRNGDLAIFITRFLLTPLAVPTNLIAGISNYPFPRFLIYTVAGTSVFIVFFGGLGYAFSRQWQFMAEWINSYFDWVILATIVAIVVYLVTRRLVRNKQIRATRRATADAEVSGPTRHTSDIR